MRVLVTGGCGFIGGHLLRVLLEETDWDVVSLDSLTHAGDPNRSPPGHGGRLRHLWWDLRAPVKGLVEGRIGPIDYAVHLAAESHVDRSIEDPLGCFHNNAMGTAHFIDFALRSGAEKAIVLSTDEVFGPTRGAPFGEFDAYRPSNPYAGSKAAGDCLAYSYWRTYGLPYIGLHAMNNFGEGQHPEKFIPKCVRLLREGLPVPVHAEWRSGGWRPGSRTWIHASDTAKAILFVLRNVLPARHREGESDPCRFNVVGERELDNLEVVRKVALIMGVEPMHEFEEFHRQRPGHDRNYSLDGSGLRALGWGTGDFDRQFAEAVLSFTRGRP